MSQLSEVQFRHFGLYGRGVTWAEAALDRRAVKCLFRIGTTTRSTLHQRMGRPDKEKFDASIMRLVQWGFVEVASTGKVTSYEIWLTQGGKAWGLEYVSQEQLGEEPKELKE